MGSIVSIQLPHDSVFLFRFGLTTRPLCTHQMLCHPGPLLSVPCGSPSPGIFMACSLTLPGPCSQVPVQAASWTPCLNKKCQSPHPRRRPLSSPLLRSLSVQHLWPTARPHRPPPQGEEALTSSVCVCLAETLPPPTVPASISLSVKLDRWAPSSAGPAAQTASPAAGARHSRISRGPSGRGPGLLCLPLDRLHPSLCLPPSQAPHQYRMSGWC